MKKEKKRIEKRGTWLLAGFLIFLGLGCIVFGILCLRELANSSLQKNFHVWANIYGAFITILTMLPIVLLFKGKEAFAKTIVSVFTLVLFVLFLWYILQRTGFFVVFSDAESLQRYLENAGAWMPALYMLLQFLQVVILPIPSIVSTVAGVAIFGAFWTTVYSFIGIFFGSVLAFFIGRKWGNKAASWIVGEETLTKWQRKLKGKDNLFLTLMFLLPLFPDDILCFIAGLSSMSTLYFLIMMSISRILAITSTCYSVNFIPFNTWWGILLWGIILGGIIITAVFVYRNIDGIQRKIKQLRNRVKK